MTIQVDQTSNTNTFGYFINRVNELANAMSTQTVTVNSNTTIGSAAITGTFTANVLSANTLVVNNNTSSITIEVPNTSLISNGNYYLNANGSWNPIILPVSNTNINTTGTSAQEIDSYSMTTFGGVEFFIRIKDNNANSYQAVKVLSFHNNSTAFSTEYGSMVSNVTLGTFSVSSNTTHVKLLMTPTSTNTSVSISRVNF